MLDEYLRELDGSEAEQLRELGDALGIPERSGRRLENGNEYARLHALTWLTLLKRPEPYFESTFEPQTPRERATAVTLLQSSEQLPDTETAVSMLLHETTEQFTVFGQDTLYRVSRMDPAPLLETANNEYDAWPDPLLAQVLAVCAQLETSVRDESLGWLTAAMEADNELIQAAAAEALGSFGWRPSLRGQVFLTRATSDPSPLVRAAVYEMLASWGDDHALTALLDALFEEENDRALTQGTTALMGRRDRIDSDVMTVLGDAWAWSYEHSEYDRLARGLSVDRVGG